MNVLLQSSILERHAQKAEQFPGFLVGLGGGDEDHLHAANLLNLVVLDLREDQLLANAQRVVAAAVEGLGGHAAEVAHTGEHDADELVGEQQVVVKPFPKYLSKYDIKSEGLSGCTIMGDGSISLIVDVNNLIGLH